MLSRFRKAGLIVPTALALAGLLLLLGLGNWQLQRRGWKEQILGQIRERLAQPPVPVTRSLYDLSCRTASMPEPGSPCEYQPVRMTGVFDHGRERHVFTAAPKAPGVPSATPGGFWVMTPMVLDGGGTVFVNRGFVPEAAKDPARRAAGQVAGRVEVTGLYRSPQVRGTFDGRGDTSQNIWYVRDPAELWGDGAGGAGGNKEDFSAYVDMTGPTPAGGMPLPLAGKVELSNRHLEYALTWFGLAATLVAVFAAFAWGRLMAPSRRPEEL